MLSPTCLPRGVMHCHSLRHTAHADRATYALVTQPLNSLWSSLSHYCPFCWKHQHAPCWPEALRMLHKDPVPVMPLPQGGSTASCCGAGGICTLFSANLTEFLCSAEDHGSTRAAVRYYAYVCFPRPDYIHNKYALGRGNTLTPSDRRRGGLTTWSKHTEEYYSALKGRTF